MEVVYMVVIIVFGVGYGEVWFFIIMVERVFIMGVILVGIILVVYIVGVFV